MTNKAENQQEGETLDRKSTTKFLSDLLIRRLSGGYWAREVTLDYGHAHPIRVDFMSFKPVNQMSVAGIERGTFTAYEVKSCVADYKSGHGLNFIGDKNYLVTTMETYIKLIVTGELKYNKYAGIMVAIPYLRDECAEFEDPTPLPDDGDISAWDLKIIQPCHMRYRERSMGELLFCMLRSGH